MGRLYEKREKKKNLDSKGRARTGTLNGSYSEKKKKRRTLARRGCWGKGTVNLRGKKEMRRGKSTSKELTFGGKKGKEPSIHGSCGIGLVLNI